MRLPLASVRLLDPQLYAAGFGTRCTGAACAVAVTQRRGLEKERRLALYEASDRDRFWNPRLGRMPPMAGVLRQPIEFPPSESSTSLPLLAGGAWAGLAAACPGYTAPTGVPISLQL